MSRRLLNRENKSAIFRNKSTKHNGFVKHGTKSEALDTISAVYEVDNFSLEGIIDAINSDKSVEITRRNRTTVPVECATKQFLVSEWGEINSVFDVLKHDEYIDVDATALR